MNIEPSHRSGHSIVTLKIGKRRERTNRTFWKFNNSLLKDTEYVKIVKNVILETRKQYTHEPDTDSDNDSNLSINDQLFFEMLLLEIRGKTISYSSYLKKQTKHTEENILKEIADIETMGEINHEILKEKQNELQIIRNKKIEGLMIRSRAKWIEHGEKTSSYFCHLENRNYISKYMPYLWKNDNTKTVNDEETLNETRTFFERLYSNKPNKDCMLENIPHHRDIPKLSETEKLSLEGPLTLNETLNALKNMKNNRSPGSDGFTTEFFKFFWIDIGKYLLRALNYRFENRELSSTQKEGVIICLPKGQKDKHYLNKSAKWHCGRHILICKKNTLY